MGLFSRPSDRDRFAQEFVAALQSAGDSRAAKYDREAFQIRFSLDGKPVGFLELDKIYAEHCRLPEKARPADLQRLTRVALDHRSPQSFDDARPYLRPVIRSTAYFHYAQFQMQLHSEKAPTFLHHTFVEHLGGCLALDLPESVQMVAEEKTLKEWGVDFGEAMNVAMTNLAELEFGMHGIEGKSLYVCSMEDSYDASRLLLVPMVSEIEVEGDPIAVAPNRDLLIVTGSRSKEGLRAMAALAKSQLKGERIVSGIPVRFSPEGCKAWRPKGDDPIARAFRELERLTLDHEYSGQADIWKPLAAKLGRKTVLTEYRIWQDKQTGETRSGSVWQRHDAPIAIPVADEVLFSPEPGVVVAQVTWDRVTQVLGSIMKSAATYPPRFTIERFPTDAELRALGERSPGAASPPKAKSPARPESRPSPSTESEPPRKASTQPSERERFAASVMEGLKKLNDPRKARFDREQFCVFFMQDGNVTGGFPLERVYKDYFRYGPELYRDELKRIVRMAHGEAFQAPRDFDDAKQNLLPLVRTRASMQLDQLESMFHLDRAAPTPPHRPIGEHLVVSLAYDVPKAVKHVTEDMLRSWNATFDEALRVALENLVSRDCAVESAGHGVYFFSSDDGYTTSRLLLPDLKRQCKAHGTPVAIVPNHVFLMVTGSKEADGLDMVAHMATEESDHPRMVSRIPVILIDGKWATYRPKGDNETAEAYRHLERLTLHEEYRDQRELLRSISDKRNREEYFSEYRLLSSPKEDREWSTCVWQELDCPVFLPKTDEVTFFKQPDKVVGRGTWTRVVEVVGHLMKKTPHYPPRYRVDRMPTDAELKVICDGSSGDGSR